MATKKQSSPQWSPEEDKIILESKTPQVALKALATHPEFKANKRTISAIYSRKSVLNSQKKQAKKAVKSAHKPTLINTEKAIGFMYKGTKIEFDPACVKHIKITSDGISFN